MGSSYFGEPSLGNGRSSGSSKKGKKSNNKSNNTDKPKQPQRGLGVAQLEKIRLHNQMNCSYVPAAAAAAAAAAHHAPYQTHLNQEQDMRMEVPYLSVPSSSSNSSSFSYSTSSTAFEYHPNIMMGRSEIDSRTITYGDPQSRWNYDTGIIGSQYGMQPAITRPLFNLQMEDSAQKKRRKDGSNSMESNSQNSQSNETQEIDLELKLSL